MSEYQEVDEIFEKKMNKSLYLGSSYIKSTDVILKKVKIRQPIN